MVTSSLDRCGNGERVTTPPDLLSSVPCGGGGVGRGTALDANWMTGKGVVLPGTSPSSSSEESGQ